MAGYDQRIQHALTAVFRDRSERIERELSDLRLIVFSDHHRGQRDGADDFSRCQAVYHGALGHYLEERFQLLLLGDVEELWENPPHDVVAHYAATLALESRFVAGAGLYRFWGNHDDLWCNRDAAERHLGRYLGAAPARASLVEALAIDVLDGGEPVGTLLFTHGHQGTGLSDRYSLAARWFLRFLWRPLQRLTHLRPTTPSQDYALRRRHELAMHAWATAVRGRVLVTGHTHHPVFSSESHGEFVQAELEATRRQLAGATDVAEIDRLREAAAARAAELEWVLAKDAGDPSPIPPDAAPCYFNAGCCCFNDHAITGLEIADGKIRLVRWSDRRDRPTRNVLCRARLREVFARCS